MSDSNCTIFQLSLTSSRDTTAYRIVTLGLAVTRLHIALCYYAALLCNGSCQSQYSAVVGWFLTTAAWSLILEAPVCIVMFHWILYMSRNVRLIFFLWICEILLFPSSFRCKTATVIYVKNEQVCSGVCLLSQHLEFFSTRLCSTSCILQMFSVLGWPLGSTNV